MLISIVLGFLILGVANVDSMYSGNSDVVNLTPSNFDKEVIKSDAIWIVEFYAPWCGHCQQLEPEYIKAATALKGLVKVGGIDADEHKSLGSRYNVRGFPTIKIFTGDKDKPTDYNGGRTASEIVEAALAAASKKARDSLGGKKGGTDSVVELTDENFDSLVMNSDDIWLVEFFAPWCGHCKNLAPHWASAAADLKGKVKLGAVDATVHTQKASQYGINSYPTIKYFTKGKKDSESVSDYNGGRTSAEIVSWALDKLAENVAPPEIVQIVNAETYKDACEDKPLCVVSILPHILDCQSNCRNDFLKTLKTLGEKYKQKQWGWVWAEAMSQPNVEDVFDIGGFGYPALAVVNTKKMKFSLLKGSFSKEGINEFLRDLSYGRGGTAPVKGAKGPEILVTEPWDGKDAEPPKEEDYDLDDAETDQTEKEEL